MIADIIEITRPLKFKITKRNGIKIKVSIVNDPAINMRLFMFSPMLILYKKRADISTLLFYGLINLML